MNRFISFLRVSAGFLLVAVLSVIWFVALLFFIPWRVFRIKACNYYGKIVGYSITRLAGVRPIVRHRERIDPKRPAIYVANHTSTLDAFLSIWLCPVGGSGVMKKEVVYIPFFGQLYWLSGHLIVNREDRSKAIAAMSSTAEVMKKHNISVWIMPEGTRSQDGRLLPFKKGFVHLALYTGFPVIPVIIHGAHKNWEKGTLQLHTQEVEIEVLEPIDTSAWRAETTQEHIKQLQDIFVEHLKEDQRPLETTANLPDQPAATV